MDHLALYSRNCKICQYLDPEEKQKFEKCHFNKGNKDCPAKEIQFAIVGMARRASEEFKKAKAEQNITKQRKILEAVEKRSSAFRQKFTDWLSR
jgi:hypothetical protein